MTLKADVASFRLATDRPFRDVGVVQYIQHVHTGEITDVPVGQATFPLYVVRGA